MIRTVLPDLPGLLLGLAFFLLIASAKVALVSVYARRFAPRGSYLTAVAVVFNVAMVPVLLFPFFNPALHRSYDTILLLGGPLFWLLEATVYYLLARLRPLPAASLAVVVNLAQAVLLVAAVFARDGILS